MAQVIKKSTIKTKAPAIKTVDKPVAVKPVEKVETVFKKASYLNKNIQISPRKLRLLVDEVRKLSPVEALARVKFINTKSARILVQALKNIIADAKNNFNLDTNSLKFDTIKADEALKIKRMDKSHGSHFARGLIQKRHSRLVIIVKGVQK
jgi:large subunit ribosomal protein L22